MGAGRTCRLAWLFANAAAVAAFARCSAAAAAGAAATTAPAAFCSRGEGISGAVWMVGWVGKPPPTIPSPTPLSRTADGAPCCTLPPLSPYSLPYPAHAIQSPDIKPTSGGREPRHSTGLWHVWFCEGGLKLLAREARVDQGERSQVHFPPPPHPHLYVRDVQFWNRHECRTYIHAFRGSSGSSSLLS